MQPKMQAWKVDDNYCVITKTERTKWSISKERPKQIFLSNGGKEELMSYVHKIWMIISEVPT